MFSDLSCVPRFQMNLWPLPSSSASKAKPSPARSERNSTHTDADGYKQSTERATACRGAFTAARTSIVNSCDAWNALAFGTLPWCARYRATHRHWKCNGRIRASTRRSWIPYDEAVEEALAYGWIDSIVRRVDDATYFQKFAPRKFGSSWSPSNRARVERLIVSGKMTHAELRFVEAAEKDGTWTKKTAAQIEFAVPKELTMVLRTHATRKHTKVHDVGGGILVSAVTDPFGNTFGLIQNPKSPNRR